MHDLLYRPQQATDADVLEAILASLTEVLRELSELLARLAADRRTPVLESNLRSVRALANEICGECVPRAYAPDLKDWMDRIQELSRRMA